MRIGKAALGPLLLVATGCPAPFELDPGSDAATPADAGLDPDGGLAPGDPDAASSGGGGAARVHPAGFAAGPVHGVEMTLQKQDCRTCHGADLTGGVGPSCDGCHTLSAPTSWRSQCTYCHGGGDNQTGAPPRHLDGTTDPARAKFAAHGAHVTQGVAAALDCTQCHKKPADVLSAEHAFDATPGAAEVTMAQGLSPAGTYDGKGGCTNLYCHGSGRTNGTARDGSAALTCAGCHPALNSNEAAWGTMSGEHRLHLELNGVTCGDCHQTVTQNGTTVVQPALHVDGKRQIAFGAAATGMTWTAANRRCNGPCHVKYHLNEGW